MHHVRHVVPVTLDLAMRRPVWEALSTMFLDTDVTLDREHRAGILAASDYSVEELERILIDEVYPVCRGNLLVVAGEWAGFDPDWLTERIMSRLGSPFRALHGINLGRLTMPTAPEWRETKALVVALRRQDGHRSPGEIT
jgi:hypothetical protein